MCERKHSETHSKSNIWERTHNKTHGFENIAERDSVKQMIVQQCGANTQQNTCFFH